MPEPTDHAASAAVPEWCHWHQGPSGTALLIQVIEQSSGPGRAQYACAPCREQRHLIPLAEQTATAARTVYAKHTQVCQVCGHLVRGVVRRCDWGAQLWNAYQQTQQTQHTVVGAGR